MDAIMTKIYLWSMVLGAAAALGAALYSASAIKAKIKRSEEAAPNELPEEKGSVYAPLTPKAFSLCGVGAFAAFFGLGGLCVTKAGLGTLASLAIAVCLGVGAEVTASILIYALKLKSDKTELFVPNTIGAVGVVCADIPASQSGRGKIRIFKNNKIYELAALSVDEVTLTKGTKIKILLADSDTVAVVERYVEEQSQNDEKKR